ncbi:MAG TPA: hypothetical protein VML55_25715 [Planctomycetaceae bacterium]|nr:hypothetical protein [Planctomycetaceae bacterium]
MRTSRSDRDDTLPHVHSLVRLRGHRPDGWYAPVELGEAAPQYANFVVPVTSSHCFFDRYTCELGNQRSDAIERRLVPFELRLVEEALVLTVGKRRLWFVAAPGAEQARVLEYRGALSHPDFAYPLIEIEPHDPGELDQLFDEQGWFLIGCDPFTHYGGLDSVH